MAGITLAQAEAKLSTFMSALDAIATGQRYAIEVDGSRRELTRADLAQVQKSVEFWDQKVKSLTRAASGASRTRYMVR